MLSFLRTSDNYSLDILRHGKHIGYLQWHKERSPRVILEKEYPCLTISEMKWIIEDFDLFMRYNEKMHKENLEKEAAKTQSVNLQSDIPAL